MCYYNGINIGELAFIKLKNLEQAILDKGLFDQVLVNGFDYGTYPVLKKKSEVVDFIISPMEWGFLPSWVTSRYKANQFRNGYKKEDGSYQPPFTTLNAKGEELLLPGKMFRDAALSRRCLVPSSGFYEWQHIHPISQKTGKALKTPVKQPHYIYLKNRPYFYMAGIWQPFTDRETGEYSETFAIITTRANELMEEIHNTKKRMPVILTDDLAYSWLFDDLTESEIQKIAGYQYNPAEMGTIRIEKDFRNSPTPTKEMTVINQTLF